MTAQKHLRMTTFLLITTLVFQACKSTPLAVTESGGGSSERPATAVPQEPAATVSGPALTIPADISEGEKADLLNQVAYFAAGGGGSGPECDFEYNGINFFTFGFGNSFYETGVLCFQDVVGQNALLSLYYPDGSLAAEPQPLSQANEDGYQDYNELPDLGIRLWLPATMPSGTYRAVMTTDSEQRDLEFTIDYPYISVVTQTSGEALNPFVSQEWDPYNQNPLVPGDRLLIHGANFTPDSLVYLTMLNLAGNIYDRMGAVERIEVRADASGRFWLWFTVSDAYREGKWYRMHFTEDADALMEAYGALSLFTLDDVSATWEACPGLAASSLRVGDAVAGTALLSESSVIRTEPRLDAEQAGTLTNDTIMDIMGGPACADGLVWWYLESVDDSLSGWASEGG